MENLGYKPNFLGDDKIVELPTVSPQQLGNIVTNDSLRDGIILDYLNYSVVMNKQTRLALYSAGNADFKNNTGKGGILEPTRESIVKSDNIRNSQ